MLDVSSEQGVNLMPLPTWYRFIRTLLASIPGVFMLAGGIYTAVAPTSYRDPNNPKMVAYANSIHPVVVAMGICFALIGLGLLYFGGRLYFRMPEGLREYSYEQLRLGQVLAREIIRLTKSEEFHSRSLEYDDGSEIYISSDHYFERHKSILNFIRELPYGFGERVSYHYSQPGTEVDGVLHIPEVRFYIDDFSGKADRHESVDEYELREEPPAIDPDSLLGEAIRIGAIEGEISEAEAELIEPSVSKVYRTRERRDDWFAHYKFMRQMGLDKPSVEELERAIDKLKEW